MSDDGNGSEGSGLLRSDRRGLLKTGFAGVAMAAAYGRIGAAQGAASDQLRVGVIGTGAVRNISQGKIPNVKLVAMGDLFKDRVDESLKNLQKIEGHEAVLSVTPDKMFSGFDAYQKVLATDCNYVILASPPGFRPTH